MDKKNILCFLDLFKMTIKKKDRESASVSVASMIKDIIVP